jgi:hypothetical protein
MNWRHRTPRAALKHDVRILKDELNPRSYFRLSEMSRDRGPTREGALPALHQMTETVRPRNIVYNLTATLSLGLIN